MVPSAQSPDVSRSFQEHFHFIRLLKTATFHISLSAALKVLKCDPWLVSLSLSRTSRRSLFSCLNVNPFPIFPPHSCSHPQGHTHTPLTCRMRCATFATRGQVDVMPRRLSSCVASAPGLCEAWHGDSWVSLQANTQQTAGSRSHTLKMFVCLCVVVCWRSLVTWTATPTWVDTARMIAYYLILSIVFVSNCTQ